MNTWAVNILKTRSDFHSAKLRRFHDIYVVLFLSTVVMILAGMFICATRDPLRTEILSSPFTILIYTALALSVAPVMKYAFPPPFSRQIPGEGPDNRLRRERLKLVFLSLISGSIFTRVFYFSEQAAGKFGPEWIGWGVIGLVVVFCTWQLWPYQVKTWRAVANSLLGRPE